jgi:glycosyltransferase involved in cell wall biosynthesis
MKTAIIHDWLTNMGGAERIIRLFHTNFPDAPIYTIVFNQDNMPDDFKNMNIKTSFIQKLPLGINRYRDYLPLMPKAVESWDLSEYDLVLSSSTSCAKGVKTCEHTTHICYCNTPMRYAWDMYDEYIQDKNLISRKIISLIMKYIRKWDYNNSQRVDYFIANSQNVQERIKRIYNRDSEVIHPPVDSDYFNIDFQIEKKDYYLIVSRLVPYKKVDIAINACNKLGRELIIIGDGPEQSKYSKLAKDNIKLLGRLSDEKIKQYYQGAKAFLFCGEEDFGITPLEAQACGTPVIAYAKGGALETVLENKTGLFFKEQTVESLSNAITDFEERSNQFNKEKIRQHAETFNKERFINEINYFIKNIDENNKGIN